MDKDLENLVSNFSGYGVEEWMKTSFQVMAKNVQELRNAIRKHRDEKGQDRCWLDDLDLYKILPEKLEGVDLTLPPKEEFLNNCERYHAHRQDPTINFIKQNNVQLEHVVQAGYCIDLFLLLSVYKLENGQYVVDEGEKQTPFASCSDAIVFFLERQKERKLGYKYEKEDVK